MDDNHHLVSIIMAVYNGEEFIFEAIQSVLGQSYSCWELLIVNDGSTDKTEDIILSFTDDRIRYFKQENRGVSAARNVALSNISGHYFCFLDADDIFPENSLLCRLEAFSRNENIDFVDGKVEVFDTKTKIVKRIYSPNFQGNPFYELISLSGNCFFGVTWMFKNKGLHYSFNENMTHSEDLLFYIKYGQEGIYDYTNALTYKCRTGNNSAMMNLSKLEDAYFNLYYILKDNYEINNDFKTKIKSIMFKSYLSKFNIIKALKVIFR